MEAGELLHSSSSPPHPRPNTHVEQGTREELLGEGCVDKEQVTGQDRSSPARSTAAELLTGLTDRVQSPEAGAGADAGAATFASQTSADGGQEADEDPNTVAAVVAAGEETYELPPIYASTDFAEGEGEKAGGGLPDVRAAVADAEEGEVLRGGDAACITVADVREEGDQGSPLVFAGMAGVDGGMALGGEGRICNEAEFGEEI